MAALTYPDLNPVAFSIGPMDVRWYGLAYIVAFIGAAFLLRDVNRRWRVGLTNEQQLDIVLAAVIGVIVGSRLGYVLFYGGAEYWQHPLRIFATWDGGMSFHGGLVGILTAGWIATRKMDVSFLRVADMGTLGAPIGFFFGRLANFVNGELWGRVTDQPWGMVFPSGGPLPRHPSQLYEAFFEGLVLITAMLVLSRRKRPDGFMLGVFLLIYGTSRFLIEFVREPDAQLGFILGPFSMGQLLSVPMLAIGGWLVWRARRAAKAAEELG